MNLEIKNVYLTIEGKSIVNDVSITVCPGEVVGLMGPNGLERLLLLILLLVI